MSLSNAVARWSGLAGLFAALILSACVSTPAPNAPVAPPSNTIAVPAPGLKTYEYQVDVEDYTDQCIPKQDMDLLVKESTTYKQESGSLSVTSPSPEAVAAAKKAQHCVDNALQDTMNKTGQQGWHLVNFTSSPVDPPLDEYGLETSYRIIWER